MNCTDRDQDLLLLAHGQTDWLTALGARLHLLSCAACRERYRRFAEASLLLRQGTRSTAPGIAITGSTVLLRAGVIVLIALTFALLFIYITHGQRPVRPASQSQPCRPDLPNDRCN